jgi:ubiquinone/menaquinone biosynthesis C-methylase UbiE
MKYQDLKMNLEKYKQVIPQDFSKEAELIDKTIKDLKIGKKAKILDVGTGFGSMAILLALNGFNVLTGQPEHDPEWEKHHNRSCDHKHETDYNHYFQNVKSWEENAKTLGVRDKIEFQFIDVEKLGFPDENFDAIFMFDSLQHVNNRKLALNQCLRVLKPHGLVCVIEWNKQSVDYWNKKEDLGIDSIDPKEILDRQDTAIQLVKGKEINIFILRKSDLR